MTAGTVVITGGILATVILLCIIAVLCYCRLQYYCCKKEESDSEEEEPDFAVTSRLPAVHSNHSNILAAAVPAVPAPVPTLMPSPVPMPTPNGPALFTPPPARKLTRSQTFCPSCTHYDMPFYLQQQQQQHQQPDGLRNGGERLGFRAIHQPELALPAPMPSYHKLHLNRSVTMREMFTRSCSISTDV